MLKFLHVAMLIQQPQSRRQNDEFKRKSFFFFALSLSKFLLFKIHLKSTHSSAIWFYRMNAAMQLCVKSKKLMDLLQATMKNEQVICIYAIKHIKWCTDRGHEKWYYCLWATICHFQLFFFLRKWARALQI